MTVPGEELVVSLTRHETREPLRHNDGRPMRCEWPKGCGLPAERTLMGDEILHGGEHVFCLVHAREVLGHILGLAPFAAAAPREDDDLHTLVMFIEDTRAVALDRDELLAMIEKPWRYEPEARLRTRYREATAALAALPDDGERPAAVLAILAGLRREFPDGAGLIGREVITPTLDVCLPDLHPLYVVLPGALLPVVSEAADALDALHAAVGDTYLAALTLDAAHGPGYYGRDDLAGYVEELGFKRLNPDVWMPVVRHLFAEGSPPA